MIQQNNHTNLEQEVNGIMAGLLDLQMKKANVKGASKLVRNVCGVVRLSMASHCGLTLDSGTTAKPYVLPLSVTDSARYLPQLVALCGKTVRIHELLVVCERFYDPENVESTLINIIVNYGNITFLENSDTAKIKNEDVLSNLTSSEVNVNKVKNNSECLVMVHNVSMPFHDKILSTTFCLVLVSYISCSELVKKLWLVLKSSQVSWKDFITCNREYIVSLPAGLNKDYLDHFQKPLDKIFDSLIRELRMLYHHKDWFQTLNGCELPADTKLFLKSNSNFSFHINKLSQYFSYTFNPFSPWFRADEADQVKGDLVSVYGRVHSIMYDRDLPHQYCYKRTGPREPVIYKSQVTATHSWLNPLESSLKLENAERLELPQSGSVCQPKNSSGGLVQTITFKEPSALKEVSVYIKHSHLPNVLPLPRIVPGLVLGISNLIRRRSSSGNCYLIATLLSDFKVLSCGENESEDWGRFGLHLTSDNSKEKIWGTLSSFNLMKLAIRSKCNGCKALFHRNRCSEECPSKTCSVSAHAICWINVILKKNLVSLEKVLIKDHLVQKLLQMPDDIWAKLQEAACESEIICLFNDNDSYDGSPLNDLIKIYCNSSKPNGDFYISVRKLTSTSPDEAPFFFCVNLEPINHQRLGLVADIVKREASLR